MKLNVKLSTLTHSEHHKTLMIIISIATIILLISSFVYMSTLSQKSEISGTLFINSIPSPEGVEVKIVFSQDELSDPSGTDEHGRYRIDVTGFEGSEGLFIITYNETEYPAQKYNGELQGRILFESIKFIEMDLYVYITNDQNEKESPSDSINETDDQNDANNDIPSTNESSDNTTQDENNDTNSSEEDNAGMGSPMGGFSPSGGGSSSSNGDSGDSNNDEPVQEEHFSILASAGIGGTINPNGIINITADEYINFTINASDNYFILDVIVDNVSKGRQEYYNFSQVNQDHNIYVEFKEINKPPTITEAYPNNQEANYNPRLQVTVNDPNKDELSVIFRTFQNNSWQTIDIQTGYNGLFTQHTQNMDVKNSNYYWSINVTDGEFWNNQSFSFVAQPFVLKWIIPDAPVNTVGPVAEDINDDGIYEVFLTGEEKIICVNGSTGEINWEYYDDQIMHHTIPVIEDLNNDGIEEIVMSCEFTQAGVTGKTIAIHANNGSLYWRVDAPSDHRHLVVADIEGNGYPYVYVCSHINSEGALRKLRGTDGETLEKINIYYPCHGGLSYEDLDDDGNFELLLGDYNRDPGKGIHCYDPFDLSLKWYERARADPQVPVIVDVNNDGILDIVTGYGGVYVIDGSTGVRMPGKWGSERFPSHSPVTVYDIDLDGNLEVLICREGSNVSVFDLERWELDTILEEGAEEPPFMADVIGDSKLEIISTKLIYDQGIVIYNHTYDIVETIDRAANRWTCVQDIDNDGQNEFLFTIGGEGLLYAYETSAYTPEQHVRSGLYGYSERANGAAVYVRPPGAPQPIIRNEYPINNSKDVIINPELFVDVIDFHYAKMNITISTNASGTWETIATFNEVDNGRYSIVPTNMDQADTTYFWKVIAVDPYADNITSTQIYKFKTNEKPEIINFNISKINVYQNEALDFITTIFDDSPIDEINTIVEYPSGNIQNISIYKQKWTTLSYDDFESGWGNFTSGGDDASLYTEGGKLTQDGVSAGNIQDNSGANSSIYLNKTLNLDSLGFTAIQIDFWMTSYGMNDGHDYYLEFYDGESWHQIKRYEQNRGSFAPEEYSESYYKFANWLFFQDKVIIKESDYNFSNNAMIRFRCDAGGDNDDVYIDQIFINASIIESTPFISSLRFDTIGVYNCSIWCKDIKGNSNTSDIKQFNIIEDIQKPSILSINAKPNNTIQGSSITFDTNISDNSGLNQVTINITTPDNGKINYSIISNKVGENTYYLNQEFYVVGNYSYSIWVEDLNGNQNTSKHYFFTINDAPAIQYNETPRNNSLDVLFNPELSIELQDYSSDDINWSIQTNVTGFWTILNQNLLENGSGIISASTNNMDNHSTTYFWSVNISDGDQWTNRTYHFTIEPTDTTDPIISNITITPNPQARNEMMNISCQVSDNKIVNQVKINITFPNNSTINETMNQSYFYNTSFNEIGNYSCFIWAIDSYNNTVSSNNMSFIISSDAEPIMIDNTNSSIECGGNVEINITIIDLDNVTDVQLIYGFNDYPQINESMNQSGNNWIYHLSIPLNATELYYNVSAEDTFGFDNNTGIIQIPIIDNINPILIDNSQTTSGTGNNYTFHATAIDNIGISEVKVSYWFEENNTTNITLNQEENSNNYSQNILIPINSTELLCYKITIFDISTNENTTEIKNVTIIDDDPPSIDNIQSVVVFDSVNITCNVTDNILVHTVMINISNEYNYSENLSMIYLDENKYYFNTTILPGSYFYVIYALDATNNQQKTSIHQFEIQ